MIVTIFKQSMIVIPQVSDAGKAACAAFCVSHFKSKYLGKELKQTWTEDVAGGG